MRSKTLSSEFTIFKKDLTRFSPVWLGLCAYLMIWATTIITSGQGHGDYYEPVAPILAPILAIVVFGYLCDPKECCMVHSLPIRRERLFLIHVASALLMFLVPTGIFCAVTRDFATQKAMYRFLFLSLEFLFLFSIGVLCMMLTGRKIGAALLYIFIQTFTIITGVIINSLYLPLLPGVYLGEYMFNSPMVIIGSYADFMHNTDLLAMDWAFIGFFTFVSLVILWVSLALYRRRKLEHAGDLLSVQWLDPFFALCSGISGASLMVILEYDNGLLFLPLGAAIGYFSYWMLSKKTARVFTLKNIGGFVCMIMALVVSMYLTYLDPLDRVSYVPEPHQVAEVSLSQSSYDTDDFHTTDPAVIADLTSLHSDIAAQYTPNAMLKYDPSEGNVIFIDYKLENGRTILREYYCKDQQLLDRAAWFLSQPIARFQVEDPVFTSISVRYSGEYMYLDPRLMSELADLILTECREGRMFSFDYADNGWTLNVMVEGQAWHTYLPIPDTAVDTIAWLEAHCTAPK